MFSLSDVVTVVKLVAWVYPKAKKKLRKESPLKVHLPPAHLMYDDDGIPPGYKRIESWDDLRDMVRR